MHISERRFFFLPSGFPLKGKGSSNRKVVEADESSQVVSDAPWVGSLFSFWSAIPQVSEQLVLVSVLQVDEIYTVPEVGTVVGGTLSR